MVSILDHSPNHHTYENPRVFIWKHDLSIIHLWKPGGVQVCRRLLCTNNINRGFLETIPVWTNRCSCVKPVRPFCLAHLTIWNTRRSPGRSDIQLHVRWACHDSNSDQKVNVTVRAAAGAQCGATSCRPGPGVSDGGRSSCLERHSQSSAQRVLRAAQEQPS